MAFRGFSREAPGQFFVSSICSWPAEAISVATGCSLRALLFAIAVGTTHTDRPPSFSKDQYQLCYRAALEYLGSFDHYAT